VINDLLMGEKIRWQKKQGTLLDDQPRLFADFTVGQFLLSFSSFLVLFYPLFSFFPLPFVSHHTYDDFSTLFSPLFHINKVCC
jgi:hypothetical protein